MGADRDAFSEESPGEPHDRRFVTALARGLEVLRCFGSGEERLSNQELSARTGLPKSTVARLTYTLTALGYLHQVEGSGRYRLGLSTLALGGTTLARLDVKELSRPLIQDLANDTGSLISLGMPDGVSMLYIELCRGQSLVTLQLDIGSRIPMATTAMGRAYLVAQGEETRTGIEDRLRSIYPAAWPAVKAGIERARRDYAQYGCCRSFGDWNPEIHGIAAPLALGQGLPPLVLSAAGAARLIPAQTFMRDIRPRLLATVREIERRCRTLR